MKSTGNASPSSLADTTSQRTGRASTTAGAGLSLPRLHFLRLGYLVWAVGLAALAAGLNANAVKVAAAAVTSDIIAALRPRAVRWLLWCDMELPLVNDRTGSSLPSPSSGAARVTP